MTDALSCIICFQPYDLDTKVPKVFPCQHTVCLVCAQELCQQECGDTFPCPTCQQPVPIPSKGASGLKTNLDVSNMVEIMQGTTVCSIAKSYCPDHPSMPMNNVCMVCKVGLCSKCFTSTKQHSDHKVVESDEAFDEITKTCDALAKEGKETCQLLQSESQAMQAKRNEIESVTIALQSARASKCLRVFEIIEKLSRLLKTSPGNKEHNDSPGNLLGANHIPDRSCTEDKLQDALSGLDHGEIHFNKASEENVTAEAITYTKLASVTILLDLLRVNLHKKNYDGSVKALKYMWSLTDESESCCHRIVLLGGAELLVLYLEANIGNKDITQKILGVYGNLAEHYSLHTHLMTTKALNMIVHCIKNSTMPLKNIPSLGCGSLAHFLYNTTVRWPKECCSREEASALITDTCENFDLDESLGLSFTSFRSLIFIMSQHVSQAAKYWAVCQLYSCIHRLLDDYCPMLIRDGGLPVLEQQHTAPEFVQKLSQSIVEQVMN